MGSCEKHCWAGFKMCPECLEELDMTTKQKQSGFEDDPSRMNYCQHPSHHPPNHMVIPAGQQYRHICPSCGKESVIKSNAITCEAKL
jgi:predicted RNA-binding Zn-ribbon protein involved in translation (DUF1610 family)